MTKLLLLDLDGCIREPLSGKKFIQYPRDQKVIKGADRAIAYHHQEGYQILGISNQGGVAAQKKSFTDCVEEQRYTLHLFPQMVQICFCPDFEGKECWVVNQVSPVPLSASSFGYEGAEFRKPGAGMLKFAMWQYSAIPQDCFYVGDREEDALAADAAGIMFFWPETWRDAVGMRSRHRWVSPEYKV